MSKFRPVWMCQCGWMKKRVYTNPLSDIGDVCPKCGVEIPRGSAGTFTATSAQRHWRSTWFKPWTWLKGYYWIPRMEL